MPMCLLVLITWGGKKWWSTNWRHSLLKGRYRYMNSFPLHLKCRTEQWLQWQTSEQNEWLALLLVHDESWFWFSGEPQAFLARAMVKAANRQSLTTGGVGGGGRFDPGPVHVRYVVVKVVLSQVSLRVLRFSPACSIPPIHQTHLHLQVTHTRKTKGLHSKVLSFPFLLS
jgi:hypothetical protein